jgi:AcrR family transcriptional regulator
VPTLPLETAPADTRARIIAAALQVFAARGFDAATVKEITDVAGANVASVNYYFRSKDDLLVHVLETSLRAVNEARLAAIERWEKDRSSREDRVLTLARAFVTPMVLLGRDPTGARALVRLMLQVRAIPRPLLNEVVAQHFDPVHERFIRAYRKLLPDLAAEEVIWRYDFARGAMMQILADLDPALRLPVRPGWPADADDTTIIERLAAFTAAGFRAPPIARTARKRPRKPAP